MSSKLISTHSLTKRLTKGAIKSINYQSYFNSQPHEEADIRIMFPTEPMYHFNSQPHEEADVAIMYDKHRPDISTHSLTKRLTVQSIDICGPDVISTHSLTKRLTLQT